MTISLIMSALSTILVAGTPIQQAVIESPLDTLTGGWPGILIIGESTHEERPATGKKSQRHDIVVIYMDAWDSNTRTVAQLDTRARLTLELMKQNVRTNKRLTVSGVNYALIAGEDIETHRLGILQTIEGVKLPMPMYAAALVFRGIQDLWIEG